MHVEPSFFGVESYITNKSIAKKVIKDNSYYFFLSCALSFLTAILLYFPDHSFSIDIFSRSIDGLSVLILTLIIQHKQSRVAAILLFLSFLYSLASGIIYQKHLLILIPLIFISSSIRVLQATFAFHKFKK